MKKMELLLSVILVLFVPYVLFTCFETKVYFPQNAESSPSEYTTKGYKIRIKDETTVHEMELDDYITGVVLGEMPADFEFEALKAQAVASRTYTLRCVMRSGKHTDADVCTDATCCQAYVNADDYAGRSEDIRKIKLAVEETAGQVIVYQGNLIEATYFSCSGGLTEDAIAVWGTDVPYLQSVSSPGEEGAKPYWSQYVFSIPEFRTRLGIPESTVISNESISLTYTDGESVKTMKVGDESFSGTQVRTLLTLASASFTVDVTNQSVKIRTRGNGHRVGMSQYGADAMALDGKSYDEILTHYYTGTQVAMITEEQLQAIFDKEENL